MKHLISTAIYSVLSQTTEDYEHLILDDGSDDDTWEYLNVFRTLPRLRLFRHENRRGLPQCRNFLLRKSSGEFVSILDADDILAPHKVEHHARILETRPQAGMTWGRALMMEISEGKSARKSVCQSQSESICKALPEFGFMPGWDLVSPYQVVHSATTWRKSALLRAGGYAEELFAEEAPDMFLKVGDFSEQCFEESVVVIKRVFPGNPIRNYFTNHLEEISRRLLANTLLRRYGFHSPIPNSRGSCRVQSLQ